MSQNTERLDAIQQRVDAATPGPWTHDEAFNASFVCAGEGTVADSWIIRMDNRPGRLKDKRDTEFIAAAPSDVAFLLDLARKQQAALEAVRDLHVEDLFRGHLSNGCQLCGGGVGWPCPTIKALDT